MRRFAYYLVAIAALVFTSLVLTPLLASRAFHRDMANTATTTQLGQPVAANPGFAVDVAVRRASPICKNRGGVVVGSTRLLGSMGVYNGMNYAHCRDGSLVTWK